MSEIIRPSSTGAIDLDPQATIDFLQTVPELRDVPREQLQWLTNESEVDTRASGYLLQPGDTTEHMLVLLKGKMKVFVMQQGQQKVLFILEPGAITGLLPYSRMKGSPVFSEIVEPTTALMLHKSKFHDMVCANYELTEALVHSLIDRVRIFTSLHFQNEKLMALGKLSAGLAHELNNPAAAILRNAEDLKTNIGSLANTLQTVASLHIDPAQITVLAPILAKVSHVNAEKLSTIDRMQREDEMLEWLDKHNAHEDCASPLLDAGLTVDDLNVLHASISREIFPTFLSWLSEELQTQKTAHEIATASRRISELVQSVKNYTRMDQVHDMQEVAINDGIRNTLTILQHKINRNGIAVTTDLASDLPIILGFPGELNQVWTNIMDNALDAMKKGGELTVKTFADRENVTFTVTDTGTGISPENLERIFDPFFTTKDVGEGTGVGLDVVQKVVQMHRGTIKVDSHPGHTEFRISFPRAASV
jgi:signal transduction histidine kinase